VGSAKVLDELLTGAVLMNGRVFESEVRNYVFRKGEECFVALWNDSGETARDIYLGDAVKVVNLDGTIRPIAAVNNRRKVVIGDIPCFIVGVNSALLETQLAVKVTPRRLELKTAEQRVDISITNKFSMTIKAVTMDAMFPSSWNWRPKTFPAIPFLEKGETKGFGVNLKVPREETVGDKEVKILMSFSADKPGCIIEVRRKLTIVSEFEADVVVTPKPAQRAFKITVLVTNNTETAVNLFCSIAMGSMPPQEQMIVNIAGVSKGDRLKGKKGGQKAAEFLIGDDKSLSGKSIRVRLEDRESSRFLNKRVKIE
jgi:hypothetical protein